MKPIHEQEWEYRPETTGYFGHHQHVDTKGHGFVIAPVGCKPEDVEPVLRAVAALPDMARALLAIHELCIAKGLDDQPAVDAATLALRKGGLL